GETPLSAPAAPPRMQRTGFCPPPLPATRSASSAGPGRFPRNPQRRDASAYPPLPRARTARTQTARPPPADGAPIGDPPTRLGRPVLAVLSLSAVFRALGCGGGAPTPAQVDQLAPKQNAIAVPVPGGANPPAPLPQDLQVQTVSFGPAPDKDEKYQVA